MGSPISQTEVENIEGKYGFTLPDEYRDFIIQIGNGGNFPPLHDDDACRFPAFKITEIADGCENFPSANSHGKGGVFYSLTQLDCLSNLDKAFYFTENTEDSVLQGALPFASYNDENLFRTQPFLILTDPLKGQVIIMLKGDAR